MKMRICTQLLATAGMALVLPKPALAAGPGLPDQAELGRNDSGDPCLASRDWKDPAANDPFAVSYSITCRGPTASRHLGIARSLHVGEAAAIARNLECGDAIESNVPSLGAVHSRRCIDKLLGLETVETSLVKRGTFLSVSAVPRAQGPAEELLRLLAGVPIRLTDRGRTIAPIVNVKTLPAAPASAAQADANADPDAAIDAGLRFIRDGLYLEASRFLNDALSRLPSDAPLKTRVELLLDSGLADSNLRFFDSAHDYFQRAGDLLHADPGMPDADALDHKLSIYRALDQLNRRNFGDAIGALDLLASHSSADSPPLLDLTTLRALNQPAKARRTSVEDTVKTPDIAMLSQLVIDAQAAWARSVALLAQSRLDDASIALAEADRTFEVLKGEKVEQRQIRWLDARIERQRARLLLRKGDRAGAVAALDKAIVSLQMAQTEGLTGPTLAETELERAGVIARGGGDSVLLLNNFDSAVSNLIDSDSQGAILPPAIEQYLDLLVSDAAAHPDGSSPERFFRALQAVGDPAIARQVVALQSVVTADPHLAAKVQDLADLDRERTRLRFAIDATPPPDDKTLAQLTAQSNALFAQSEKLKEELGANTGYNQTNDKPVKLAELRQALRPGEAYFKLTKVRNYVFGLLLDSEGVLIYRVKNPDVEIEPLAAAVRASIDGGGEKLSLYNVGAAYALFKLVTGPVGDRLLEAKALIVDANGPLQKLPIGVLVANRDSVARYAASRAQAPYDYTKVDFLARQMSVSTALSPRSLIVSRQVGLSQAPLPFMGFAQHQPASLTVAGGNELVSVGTGCETERKTIAMLTNELRPIDARELDRAGAALGIGRPPELIGQGFTDTAVKALTDLNQFQVLHFATHGLTEGEWGCAKSPPALVTSLGNGNSDALLSFDEIAKLKLDANLVVLSACDTASGISTGQARANGQEEAGATLEGLVRAFLAANARAVLSTYWPISDAGESEDLIADFYRAARNGTIGEALQSAQVAIMSNPKSSHPLYWGAFFVVGDSQKPLLTGKAKASLGVVHGNESGIALAR